MVISLLKPVSFSFGGEEFSLALSSLQSKTVRRGGLVLVPDSACGVVEFVSSATFFAALQLPCGGIDFGVTWDDFYSAAPKALVDAENNDGSPLVESDWGEAAFAAVYSALFSLFGVEA